MTPNDSGLDSTLEWLNTAIDVEQRSHPDFFSRSIRPRLFGKPAPQKTSEELEMLRTLGEGGMGQVFLAKQNSLDRQVAVKAIKPSQAGEYAQLAMLHEARIAGALEHPNVVPIHTLSRDPDGMPLLVMKRIDGTSWKDLLKSPTHPYWSKDPKERLQQNIEILMQVCNAIHFAHSKGVIHRDIKPENVMLGNFGEVYLLDWGIALRLEEGEAIVREVTGTLSYVAPEMLVKGATLTPRTDVYLLGATLYEILTGEPLHKSRTLVDVIKSTTQRVRRSYPAETPEMLLELCEEAISYEPSERPASALLIKQRLASFLQRRASIELATAADQKLMQLITTPMESSALEIYRLSGEAQFGFEQAKRGWPENELSAKGLLQLAEYMAEFELLQRNVTAARAHLALLPSPPERLTKRLAELEQSLTAERAALEKLKAIEYQQSMEVSAAQRVVVMIIGNLQFLGGIAVIAYLSPVEVWRAPPIYSLWLQLLFGLGIALISVTTRSYFFRNTAGKQLYHATLFLTSMLLLSHAFGFLWSLQTAQIFLWDIFLWALFSGMLGVFYSSIFLWNALADIILLAVGISFPWLSPWILWVSFLLMTISVAKITQKQIEGL